MTYEREVFVFPDIHIHHRIWVFDLPEHESNHEERAKNE